MMDLELEVWLFLDGLEAAKTRNCWRKSTYVGVSRTDPFLVGPAD